MKPKPSDSPNRCRGWRRNGGAFTFGPVKWVQCPPQKGTMSTKSKQTTLSQVLVAAEMMDWDQVVLNQMGNPPCFHLEGTRFCGRAKRWDGHYSWTKSPFAHRFVSLADLLRKVTQTPGMKP